MAGVAAAVAWTDRGTRWWMLSRGTVGPRQPFLHSGQGDNPDRFRNAGSRLGQPGRRGRRIECRWDGLCVFGCRSGRGDARRWRWHRLRYRPKKSLENGASFFLVYRLPPRHDHHSSLKASSRPAAALSKGSNGSCRCMKPCRSRIASDSLPGGSVAHVRPTSAAD